MHYKDFITSISIYFFCFHCYIVNYSDDLEIRFDEEADQKYLSMEELGNTLKCLTDTLKGSDVDNFTWIKYAIMDL